MEEEAREILRSVLALERPQARNLVLSEALKPSPEETVLRWLASQDREQLFTTTITQAEILYGVEMLPGGKRRTRLYAAIQQLFAKEFHERVLPVPIAQRCHRHSKHQGL
jgi:predicted nucleic acid-binding protein